METGTQPLGSSIEIGKQFKIVFLGDSITENGSYIRDIEAYFLSRLPEYELVLINLGVSSETASGTDEPGHPFPRPCVFERLDRALTETSPDWVVVCYGMNDGIYHPLNEARFEDYRQGIRGIAQQVRSAGARPIFMTPPPFDVASYQGETRGEGAPGYSYAAPYIAYDSVLSQYAAWLQTFGETADCSVIDIREPLWNHIRKSRERDPSYRYGDGVHPGEDGHWVIAQAILGRLFHVALERKPQWAPSSEEGLAFIDVVNERRRILDAAWREHVGHTNPNKSADALPLQDALSLAASKLGLIRELAAEEGAPAYPALSEWRGFVRCDFYQDGRECIVVAPEEAAAGRPWVWRTEFFGAFAAADEALLHQGWHIAYCRLSDLYGCAAVAGNMESFRQAVAARYGLHELPVLFGFSRGGLYALRYAVSYPTRTAGLYLDAPVVDIVSWPGGYGAGAGAPREWRQCKEVYAIDTLEQARQLTQELLDSLAGLAEPGTPMLIVAGDADEDVPLEENAALLAQHYTGPLTMIVKPGVAHHPHSLDDVTPIVDFAASCMLR